MAKLKGNLLYGHSGAPTSVISPYLHNANSDEMLVSYIEGTNYDGWSFGAESELKAGPHKMNFSLIAAPQSHNQARTTSDRDLLDALGRNYNRSLSGYQENYYFKPQFSIRDEWEIDEDRVMMTNLFITKGNGGGKYLNADKFNINTGELYFRDEFLDSDNPEAFQDLEFGQHALYLYENYGYVSENFNPSDSVFFDPLQIYLYGPSYKDELINSASADFFRSRYDYSWRNNNISDHFQVGLNTYYDQKLSESLDMVFGGEVRNWNGTHIGKREAFRYFDATAADSVGTYDKMEKNYDYTTTVLNMSAFARFKYKPVDFINFMFDGQIARYASSVEENPIEIYDMGTGEATGVFYYDTKDLTEVVDGDTLMKFEDSDYEKVYSFFSPKMGVNVNLSEYFNIRTNYSIAYKEPKTSQWYGYDGPDTRQLYTKSVILTDSLGVPYGDEDIETFYGELEPERINTFEIGMGYDGTIFDIDLNYYVSDYTDKIESVDVPVTQEIFVSPDSIEVQKFDAGLVINAGQARHQGLELSIDGDLGPLDMSSSLTLATNRWTKMNVEEIFGTTAENMKDKLVPNSPETMANFGLGYTFENLPYEGELRFGVTGKYWDDYYANYTNEYFESYTETNPGSGEFLPDSLTLKSSKLPSFREVGIDMKYSFMLGAKEAFIKIGVNNVADRKNYASANVSTDYNRGYFDETGVFVDDYLTGNETMYVTPSPLRSFYMTMEVKF
jgi:hypothetical protein